MNLPDWAIWLGVVISPVLSFAGLVLGLRANRAVQKSIVEKTTAEAASVDAEAKKKGAEKEAVDAETTDKLIKTAMGFIDPLRKELADERQKRIELETKVNVMDKEMEQMRWNNARLMAGVTQLVHQVKSIGHTPVFDPEKDMHQRKDDGPK